jgi:hypothetical protein
MRPQGPQRARAPLAGHLAAFDGDTALDVDSRGRARARLRAYLARVAAVLVGLAMAGLLVIDGSRAAVSDRPHNDGNSVAAGSVELSDGDSTTAMFGLSGLPRGHSVERCIDVTYAGSLDGAVKLYGAVAGSGLVPGLTTKVEIVDAAKTDAAFGCAGFSGGSTLFDGTLAAFAGSHSGYATGLGGFPDAGQPTTKRYKITMTMPNDDTYQGGSATVDFTWHAQGRDS